MSGNWFPFPAGWRHWGEFRFLPHLRLRFKCSGTLFLKCFFVGNITGQSLYSVQGTNDEGAERKSINLSTSCAHLSLSACRRAFGVWVRGGSRRICFFCFLALGQLGVAGWKRCLVILPAALYLDQRPQPSWYQGPVSWKRVFPRTDGGLGMIQADDIYFVAADLTRGNARDEDGREYRWSSAQLPFTPCRVAGFLAGAGTRGSPRLALQLLLVTRSSQLYPMYSTVLGWVSRVQTKRPQLSFLHVAVVSCLQFKVHL